MQMFTTLAPYRQNPAPEEMSDKSVIVSFTTRAAFEMDVPLPKNFKVVKNDADVTIDDEDKIVVSNKVELEFDKVNIKWENYVADPTVSKAVYYDLYMSTRTDINSFTLVEALKIQKATWYLSGK